MGSRTFDTAYALSRPRTRRRRLRASVRLALISGTIGIGLAIAALPSLAAASQVFTS
ncbi:hypothetical protein [Actinokineospora diospyrosa]|uniref:Uncharacterized protein n=1 Tax=Actinokineospora diospyrosa TaxID=103728 RepID=A0ABT1IFR6_9PSEU|nr:hypothetical protein [Actinokineospora diospyrosa]MCP2271455.1 hypothetical protein [Actinokineospora diospyrosa]